MNPDNTLAISLSQQVTAAISVILPVIAAVLIRPTWTDATKALVWLALSIVAGGIGVWFDGRFNVANIAGTIGMVFVIGAVTYARLWRPTGIAPAVEENINHGPRTPRPPEHPATNPPRRFGIAPNPEPDPAAKRAFGDTPSDFRDV